MGTKDKMSDRHHGDELESSGSAEEPPAIPQGEWDPSVHRLPVWATIRAAALAIAKEWKTLLKAIAVPALLLAAINVVDQAFLAILGGSRLAFLLAWLLLPGGFFTMIAISCHRLVILGVDSRSSPELCVKVRGSSSMLLLGCLGDLLRFEKREIQVATFAPDRSSP